MILAILGLLFAVFYGFTAALNKKRAEEQSAVAVRQKTRSDRAAQDATIAANHAEEMSNEALKDKKLADDAKKVAEEYAARVQEYAARLQDQLAITQIDEGRAWISEPN